MGRVNCSILDYGTVWKKIGANFSLQLLPRTQFAKISDKKVIAENQCEKHKTIEFSISSWPVFFVLTKNLFFFFIIFIFQETCNRQNIYLHIQTFSYILSTYWSYIYIHISLVVLIS